MDPKQDTDHRAPLPLPRAGAGAGDGSEPEGGLRARTPHLIVVEGATPGTLVPLSSDPAGSTIGRSPENALQFIEGSVSRRHALFRVDERGDAWLTDLNSTNGTYLNDQRLEPGLPTPLEGGDRVQFGAAVMVKFLWLDAYEERFHREMYERMVRDPLTRLFKRDHFVERVNEALSRHARGGKATAVLIADLDHFKSINDRHGHPAGDRALGLVADALRRRFEDDVDGLAGRYGGEEFVAAFAATGDEDARARAERFRRDVEALSIPTPGGELGVTVSVGMAIARPAAVRSSALLISEADECLLRAKRAGRNRVVFVGIDAPRPAIRPADDTGAVADPEPGPGASGETGGGPAPRLPDDADPDAPERRNPGSRDTRFALRGPPSPETNPHPHASSHPNPSPRPEPDPNPNPNPDNPAAAAPAKALEGSTDKMNVPAHPAPRDLPPLATGVCSWSLQVGSIPELRRFLDELGVDLVQIACGDPHHASWDEGDDMPAAALAAGMTLGGAMLGFPGEDYTTPATIKRTGGFGDPDTRAERLERLAWAVDRTRALGLTDLMLHAGFLPEPDDPARPAFLETLAKAADVAAAKGVTLAFETGQETAELLARTLDELARPNLMVNFDPANMLLYDMGDPVRAVEILGPRIRSVHAKDAIRPAVPGEWGREVPLGEGEVDFPAFLRALANVGYRGPLFVEREVGDQPARVRDIARGLRFLRETLDKL